MSLFTFPDCAAPTLPLLLTLVPQGVLPKRLSAPSSHSESTEEMNLKIIKLSERGQTVKIIYYLALFV